MCSCTGDIGKGRKESKHSINGEKKFGFTNHRVLAESCVWVYLILNVLQRLYANVAYLGIEILGEKSRRRKNKKIIKYFRGEFYNL